MMSIFPAIATMLSAFFISRYPLNEKRLYEISTELEERRKK
jgi:GPH family glycoside/pentoside/hexuronide:cation symporter